MRSCRNDKTKYVCLRDKKCQMTAESRVQCQYCRLQKCLSLNMYSPGKLKFKMYIILDIVHTPGYLWMYSYQNLLFIVYNVISISGLIKKIDSYLKAK